MSCQHLKSQSEFTKNSELPFWIFCMLTTWLRYNLATAKHLCALPLITLTSAKIFTTRWSFGHALLTLKIVWAFRLCCYAFFICIFSKSSWQTVTGLSVSLLYHIIHWKSIILLSESIINHWTTPHQLNERGIKWTIYILRLKRKKTCKFDHFCKKCISSDTKWLNIIHAKHCISSLQSFHTRWSVMICKKSEGIALFDDMHANKLRDDMPLLRNG